MALPTFHPDPVPKSDPTVRTYFSPDAREEWGDARDVRAWKEYYEAEDGQILTSEELGAWKEYYEEGEDGQILTSELGKGEWASIPLDMLKAAKSKGIPKALLLSDLDLQYQVSLSSLRHEIESSILLRNRSLVLGERLDALKAYYLPEEQLGGFSGLQLGMPTKMEATVLCNFWMNSHENFRVQGPTGSGRTTCSLFAMLNRVDSKLNFPQALYICHSRELAIQNNIAFQNLWIYTEISSKCLIPGITELPIAKLAQVTEHIILGTPPTVKKWMLTKKLDNSCLKIVILDDVDVMLAQDGFDDDLLRIMKYVEKSGAHCQVLLFSATFNETVESFVSKLSRITSFVFRLPKILVLPRRSGGCKAVEIEFT